MPDPLAIAHEADRTTSLAVRLFWHSRLKIRFNPARTYTDAGTVAHPGRTATYLHAICKNRSWFFNAHTCRSALVSIQATGKGGWDPLPGFEGPVPLHWANTPDGERDYEPISIDHGSDKRIDLGYRLHGHAHLHLIIPKAWVGVTRLLKPGRYRLLLRCESPTAIPRRTQQWIEVGIPTSPAEPLHAAIVAAGAA